MKKGLFVFLVIGLLILPFIGLAQINQPKLTPQYDSTAPNIIPIMTNISELVWRFFAGLSVIMFIVAGILFLTSNGDPGKITTARNALLWGVVGVIVAIFAFSAINIIRIAVGV